jgi:hypothetical protein
MSSPLEPGCWRRPATLLYKEELAARPGNTDEDWMALIFQYMAKGADTLTQFSNNPVTFVTFNYDRYLEYRFIRGLIARYNVQSHEAWTALRGKVLHVYGSLGDLPERVSAHARHGGEFAFCGHELGVCCEGCGRWSVIDLHALIAAGQGERRLATLKTAVVFSCEPPSPTWKGYAHGVR